MSKLQRPCNSQRRLITSASLRCLYKSLCVRDLQILKHAIRHQFSETAIPLKRCSQVRVSRRKINDGYQWRIQNFIIAGGTAERRSLNFYLKKVGFGAFWDDFLRSERHKKRHTRPAVLILYHSCIRQCH